MYKKYPEEFYSFYKKYLIYPEAKPNKAHYKLAKLEKIGKLKAIITQNIDILHENAGSKNVIKLHGSVDDNYCQRCGRHYDMEQFLELEGVVPYCESCGYIVKPDVTLYEEALKNDIFDKAIEYIKNADTLIIGGTSLVVYPAASLINYFKGKNLILINKSTTSQDYMATLVINEKIGEVLSKVI